MTADALTRRIRALLEIASQPAGELELQTALTGVARIIAEALEFGAVAVNLERPAFGDLEVVAVHGNDEVSALLGTRSSRNSWDTLLDPRFESGGVYVVRHDTFDWEGIPNVLMFPAEVVSGPDAWHAEDAILAPMHGSSGELLGIISVDLPVTGRHPPTWQLAVLAAAAQTAGLSVEAAARAREERRLRHALELLVDVPARSQESQTIDEILNAICSGVRSALGFERVSAQILDEANGTLLGLAGAGWPEQDEHLRNLTSTDLAVLFEPALLRAGCCLLERERALELVPGLKPRVVSSRSGSSEKAWRNHWLFVPLLGRAQRTLGFLWVDDPVDCLLPSEERLRTLRMFADQAARALESAAHVDALARRSEELSALHDTTLALIERLDASEILQTIMERACELVHADHGVLYLRHEDNLKSMRLEVGSGELADGTATSIAHGQGLAGTVWATGEPLAVHDYSRWQRRLRRLDRDRLGPVAAVPLWQSGVVVGVLGLVRRSGSTGFSGDDVVLLERFGRLVSLALEKRRLYAELASELAERRETEDALHQSRELYRRVVENSSELICLLDEESRFVYASPTFAAVLGHDPNVLQGTSALSLVHQDDRDQLASTEDTPSVRQSFSLRVRHAEGRWVTVEVASAPIFSEDGRPEMTLLTGRDVTEQRRIERERQALEEELRQAQRMEAIGRLAGGVAHDFNNILTGIIGYADLALDRLHDRTSGPNEDIAEIRRAALRAGALTRQLLAFSRKQVFDLRVVDLNAIVSETAGMLGPLLGERVTVELEIAGRVLPIRADTGQVGQVLMNLVINARDAMPDGGAIRIATGYLPSGSRRKRRGATREVDLVRLVVTDTGIGMDDETLARAFEPFFTTKPIAEGTGLGLSTVHGIVHQLGGEIRVRSTPGKGSAFEIRLPAVAATLESAADSGAGASSGTGRVLLVEDEDLVRALARRALERAGFEVHVAASGEAALALVRAARRPFDALVTDVVMSGMSGPDLARVLTEQGVGLPVLFMSGYTADHLGELPREAVFLPKPFRPGELVEKLQSLLDEGQAADDMAVSS